MSEAKEIRIDEAKAQSFSISFTRFEAQTLLNAICEALESLKGSAFTARGKTLLEIAKAVDTLECITGRLMDRL